MPIEADSTYGALRRLCRTRTSWKQQKDDERLVLEHLSEIARLVGAASDVDVDLRTGVLPVHEVRKEFTKAVRDVTAPLSEVFPS